MMPDKYYDIEDLEKCWTAWDITEKDLLKYGAEGTLQFSINKGVLEKYDPDCIKQIQYLCPSLSEAEQRLCPLAANQTIFKLSPETIEGLRYSKPKSLVKLLSSCLGCEDHDSNDGKILRHNIFYTEYFFHHFYEPAEDLDGKDIGEQFLDNRYCNKKDLIVSRDDKENFEKEYLQDDPQKPSIAKESTLLRVIGALLITSFNKKPFINSSNKIIASAIADHVAMELSNADLSLEGISSRKLREIFPLAYEAIQSNKI